MDYFQIAVVRPVNARPGPKATPRVELPHRPFSLTINPLSTIIQIRQGDQLVLASDSARDLYSLELFHSESQEHGCAPGIYLRSFCCRLG
jgi:hypothetical protein